MDMQGSNIKKLLDLLEISSATLAKAMNVDASYISRWVRGQRLLKFTSDNLTKLSEYFLDKIMRTDNTDWLKRQMESDGLLFDYDSSGALLNALKLWLSHDGGDVSKSLNLQAANQKSTENIANQQVLTGNLEIALFFEKTLSSLPDGFTIDIHLSNEDIGILLHESISRMLMEAMSVRNYRIRLVVTMSSGVMAMSRLLIRYMQSMIEGYLNVAVVHGTAQVITNQATFIFGDTLVFLVSETPKTIAPPIGMATHETSFVKESKKSFDRAYNFSQPLLQRYDDNLARNVIEIMYHEFAMPGDLDIIKDNLNPVYIADYEYSRYLNVIGHTGEQHDWRMNEFHRFKAGIHENLNNGTVFREIISMKRIGQVIEDGYCKMPGLYFFGIGIADLDANGCLSILEGYVEYLNKYQSFHLIILDDLPEFSDRSCWHIKRNHHWMLNGWSKDEHIILYTDQLILTHEFQTQYDDIWNKTHYSEGRRKQTIAVLQDSINQLKEKHGLTKKCH